MPGLEEADFGGNKQLFSTKEAVAAFAAGIGEAGLPKFRKLDVRECDIPASAAGELGSLLGGKICDFLFPTNPSPERGAPFQYVFTFYSLTAAVAVAVRGGAQRGGAHIPSGANRRFLHSGCLFAPEVLRTRRLRESG